jgi:hypothetical protein
MVRKGFAALILIGLIASLYITYQDFSRQDNNKGVILALDYTSVKEWSQQTGIPVQELLKTAADSQISHIALSELELKRTGQRLEGFYAREVDVSAYLGNEIADMIRTDVEFTKILDDQNIGVDNVYIVSENESRIMQLRLSAQEKYGRNRVELHTDGSTYIIEIISSLATLINGLGFDSNEIDLIEDYGFKIIPRPINVVFKSEQLRDYVDYIDELLNPDVVIFAGEDGVLGNRIGVSENLIPVTASKLYPKNPRGMMYGYVEMTSIDGDKELASLVGYNLVRTHSISSDEWKRRYNTHDASDVRISEVVERYALAVNDRTSHVLYVRPFSKGLDFNSQYFSSLTSRLTSLGYTLGSVRLVPIRNALSRYITILLLAGVGGALALLFLEAFKGFNKLAFALVLIGLVGGTGLVYIGYGSLINRYIAFFASLAFPTLAIFVAYIWNQEENMSIARSCFALIKAVGVSLIGAMYVHASLATSSYLTSMAVFPMVKIALIAPAFILAFLFLIRKDVLNDIKEFLQMNIQVYHVVLAGIAFVVLAVLAMRSGNNPIIPVSSLEIRFRLLMQKTLIARPRFKEFMIGYPLLIIAGMYVKNNFTKLLLIAGSIGLASLVNTFAHLHKPVWMAFLTTINGLWTGLLIGLIAAVIISYLHKLLWSDKSE